MPEIKDIPIFMLEEFMRESNKIEGEVEPRGKDFTMVGRLNPGDINAMEYAGATHLETLEDILHVQGLLGAYLKADWTGRLRNCNVRVGSYKPPVWQRLPSLMEEYMKEYPKMDAWTAHNEWQHLHPCRDLNGRTGRLIWLVKAIEEGYNFKLTFLHAYYYSTLSHGNRTLSDVSDPYGRKGESRYYIDMCGEAWDTFPRRGTDSMPD